MKKRILRSFTLLTLLVLALTVTAWAISLVGQQSGAAGKGGKTLRETAHQRDVEVDVPEAERNVEYGSLDLLAKHAEAIVVGQIIEEKSSFDGDDDILTSYQIDIRQVLKDTKLNGPLNAGEREPDPLMTPLKVTRPGGLVHINGHKASKKLRASEALKVGKDYLFFLWWSPSYQAYTFAGGVSGVLSIQSDLTVKPLGSKNGMAAYNGSTLEAIVNQVRGAN